MRVLPELGAGVGGIAPAGSDKANRLHAEGGRVDEDLPRCRRAWQRNEQVNRRRPGRDIAPIYLQRQPLGRNLADPRFPARPMDGPDGDRVADLGAKDTAHMLQPRIIRREMNDGVWVFDQEEIQGRLSVERHVAVRHTAADEDVPFVWNAIVALRIGHLPADQRLLAGGAIPHPATEIEIQTVGLPELENAVVLTVPWSLHPTFREIHRNAHRVEDPGRSDRQTAAPESPPSRRDKGAKSVTVRVMRILVTGGGGFLGSAIVRRLRARGDEVVAFQRSDAPELAALGTRVVRGSITARDAVSAAAEGCDAVIHTAAKAGVWGKQAEYEAINVTGTRHVIEACVAHGIKILVHTSTPSVVFSGEPFAGVDESLPYGRNWLCHYAETKARAEQLALAAGATHGLRVCALRPHLIWGPGDPHLLPRVIARARSGRLRIVGEGQNKVDLTHVDHAAAAHLQALDALKDERAVGQAFFLSDGEPIELWPWINAFLVKLDIPPITKRVPLKTAFRLGGALETVWRVFRLGGEPPMTRFVATELAKDHWFSIAAARKTLGYTPDTAALPRLLDEYVSTQRHDVG